MARPEARLVVVAALFACVLCGGDAQTGTKCDGVTCPDVSKCSTEVGGAPTCECPPDKFSRLDANYKCTAAPLLHWGYLDPHNAARAAVGSPALVWDPKLASQAQAWADKLATQQCNLALQNLKKVGQNVANFFRDPTFMNNNATDLWVDQGGQYTRAKFSTKGAAGCASGSWEDCAAYTQVVWKSTKTIGCGVGRCPSVQGKVWVCNYYPVGNIVGQFPF